MLRKESPLNTGIKRNQADEESAEQHTCTRNDVSKDTEAAAAASAATRRGAFSNYVFYSTEKKRRAECLAE